GDLPFPVRIRKELVDAGRASQHHVLPSSGWVSFYIRTVEDVPKVVELFRLNYRRATRTQSRLTVKRETGELTFSHLPHPLFCLVEKLGKQGDREARPWIKPQTGQPSPAWATRTRTFRLHQM